MSGEDRGTVARRLPPEPAPADGPEDLRRVTWTCEASGPGLHAELPDGADLPMRKAVRAAFLEIVGVEPDVLSSGWGASPSLRMRAVEEAFGAPAEAWTAHPDDLIESAWGLIANAGGGDWTKESDEWSAAAERWRERYHAALDAGAVPVGPRLQAGTSSATIGDVEKVARRLELVYVPEQHRLHAAPKEECNTDSSSGKRTIPEEKLSSVSPDVSLCKHCVSEEEARIIRAGLRRT